MGLPDRDDDPRDKKAHGQPYQDVRDVMNAQSYPAEGNEKSQGVEDNSPARKSVTENRGEAGYPRRVSRGERIAIVLGRVETSHLPWPASPCQELESSSL